jgi:hypothetical protein
VFGRGGLVITHVGGLRRDAVHHGIRAARRVGAGLVLAAATGSRFHLVRVIRARVVAIRRFVPVIVGV